MKTTSMQHPTYKEIRRRFLSGEFDEWTAYAELMLFLGTTDPDCRHSALAAGARAARIISRWRQPEGSDND